MFSDFSFGTQDSVFGQLARIKFTVYCVQALLLSGVMLCFYFQGVLRQPSAVDIDVYVVK